MARYTLGDKEVTEEEFYNAVFSAPFYLDEVLTAHIDMSKAKGENAFEGVRFKKESLTPEEKEKIEEIRNACLNTKQFLGIEDVTKIITSDNEEELESILKRDMSIGAPDFNQNNTGGTVFERLQDTTLNLKVTPFSQKDFTEVMEKASDHFKHNDEYPVRRYFDSRGSIFTFDPEKTSGKKESKTVEKAPVFTYCRQMKNAIEALSLRSLYGHKKYEKGNDWENFSRVENGDFEYSNAEFRHALGIGIDEDEEQHLVAAAWNAVSRLEIYLRNKK